jgi:hypothetical protein
MQRDMVPRMDHLGKSRNQNRIPTMLNYCVISLMQSLPAMKKLEERKNGRMPWSRNTSQ